MPVSKKSLNYSIFLLVTIYLLGYLSAQYFNVKYKNIGICRGIVLYMGIMEKGLTTMATRKKTSKKKATVKKTSSSTPTYRISACKDKVRSKADLYRTLSEQTGVGKKEISSIFDCLYAIMQKDLKNGCGEFRLSGILKVVKKHKPKRPARKGVNPFTGEEMMFKAKPASKTVRCVALKNLKEFVS